MIDEAINIDKDTGWKSYLTGRNQVVRIKDFMSKLRKIKNGNTQWSVLGSLLFTIHFFF